MEERRSVTRQSPQAAEDEATRRLVHDLAPRVDRLHKRTETQEGSAVAPRSPLAGDDNAARPFQVSHVAWHAIIHAADNLHALRILTVRETGPNLLTVVTHPYAAYPLLRAALENASTALWVLTPGNRDTRLTRRFRLLLTDAQNGDTQAALLGHEATTYAKRLVRLEPVLAARPGIPLGACTNRAGFRPIVRGAAAGFDFEPDAAEAVWRLLSGLTHGDTWASITATDRDEVAVSQDGVVTMHTTSSLANIANMTAIALTFTEAALHYFDLRRTAP